jgi:hypothetical protein
VSSNKENNQDSINDKDINNNSDLVNKDLISQDLEDDNFIDIDDIISTRVESQIHSLISSQLSAVLSSTPTLVTDIYNQNSRLVDSDIQVPATLLEVTVILSKSREYRLATNHNNNNNSNTDIDSID